MHKARFVDWGVLSDGDEPRFLTIVEVSYASGDVDRYVVPLAIAAGEAAEAIVRDRPEAVVARIAGARRGVMHGALDSVTTMSIFQRHRNGRSAGLASRTAASDSGSRRSRRFAATLPTRILRRRCRPPIARTPATRLGERFWLKMFRRVQAGAHPEVELDHFLSEEAKYTRVPRLAGFLEYEPARTLLSDATPAGEATSTVAVLSGFMPHQMDAWRQALGELQRYLEAATAWGPAEAVLPENFDLWSTAPPERARATIGPYLESAAAIGRRTAEMHVLLGQCRRAQPLWRRDAGRSRA